MKARARKLAYKTAILAGMLNKYHSAYFYRTPQEIKFFATVRDEPRYINALVKACFNLRVPNCPFMRVSIDTRMLKIIHETVFLKKQTLPFHSGLKIKSSDAKRNR